MLASHHRRWSLQRARTFAPPARRIRSRGLCRVLSLLVATTALIGLSAPVAVAATPAPVLTVSGTTLKWNAVSGASSYVLAIDPAATGVTSYQIVTGTSFNPPALPGQLVYYGLSANISGAPWATAVSINWPIPTPTLQVSGTRLSWNASPGVTSYVLAIDPVATGVTTYQTVTGASFTPPAMPGQLVYYGLSANIHGAAWATAVSINWPVPLPPAPTLSVSGTSLQWNALSGVSSYVLSIKPAATGVTTTQTVTGTSFTPLAVPGQLVSYSLRANVSGAPSSASVSINWPVPLPPAPLLSVSGTSLKWNALSGVSSYVLAINPSSTGVTSYQTVTGTSFTPPAMPGQSVDYGLRANVDGAPWAAGVSITWPATTTTTTTATTSSQPVTSTTSSTVSATTTSQPATTTSTTTSQPTSTTTSQPTTTTTSTTSSSTTTSSQTTSSGGVIVGLVANASAYGGDGTAGRLDQISNQTGSRWLREDFLWATIEPTNGSYDFTYYDHFMLLAAQKGLHILPVLDGTPTWVAPHENDIPTDPTTYAAFTAAVVNRYGPHGTFWTQNPQYAAYALTTYEIWNEPYYPGGSDNTYDPARYANLIKAAATAGRTADPTTKYLLAADVDAGQQTGSTWTNWVDALYQALPTLNNYFDAVAIHPYGTNTTTLTGIGDDQIRRTELIHQAFTNHNATNKPLWITEVGWPTCTQGPLCVSTTQQATNTTTLFNYIHTTWAPYIKAVFLFNYQDYGGDPTNSEDNYGLIDQNNTPKPANAIFKTQAATTSLNGF